MTEQSGQETDEEGQPEQAADDDRETRPTGRRSEQPPNRPQHTFRHVLITSALVAALAACTFVTVARFGFFSEADPLPIAGMTGLAWVLFFAAVVLLRRVRGRAIVALVLAGTAAIGGAALAGPPNTSTDSARYAWDGIVQSSGISPYAHVPASEVLSGLRTDWLFPAPELGTDGVPGCSGVRIDLTNAVDGSDELLCTAINRPQVPTIYPALAEMYFLAVRAPLPHDAEYWPFQLAGLALALATTAALLLALRRRGLDPRWAALFGWCPLVATEAITNSHVDMLAAALALAATLAISRGHARLGGIALGASIATKLIPVIAAPALLRRRPLRVILAASLTFLALYLPYVLISGAAVIGYLPGYFSEEGYENGSRFALLSAVLPGPAATVVAALAILALAFLVFRLGDPDRPWLGQLAMIGGTLAIVTPHYPWYGLLLLPFVALSGRGEWLLIPFALTVGLVIPSVEILRLAMLAALAVIAVVSARRHGPGAFASARVSLQSAIRLPRKQISAQSD